MSTRLRTLLATLTFLTLFTLQTEANGQQQYTLEEIVELAKANSPQAFQARNRKENRYWQYRTYRSNYIPQLVLSGEPTFNNTISSQVQFVGDTAITRFSQFNEFDVTSRLSVDQNISLTGGAVSIGSNLNRNDNFITANTQYSSQPFSIVLNQPLFAFNQLRWDNKVEPLRYDESTKQFNEEMELVALRASGLYFDLLLSQINLKIAQTNLANNDTIYRIGQGRYELGKIAENELLQLELNLITSRQQVTQAQLDAETNTLALNTFIGQPGNEPLRLNESINVPEFNIDPEFAIEQAKGNRQAFLAFRRRRLEAEREVARARGDSGIDAELTAAFGVTQAGVTLSDAYQQPRESIFVGLNISLPVVDGGRQKARIQTALSNRDLVESTIAQEEIAFEQEIYTRVRQLEILRLQVETSQKAADIAQRTYDISQQRYFVARISITDLNIALQAKDQARRSYVQALRDFWDAYYEIRSLTLYDFEANQPIEYTGGN